VRTAKETRALALLAQPAAAGRRLPDGRFGLYPGGDFRRRPVCVVPEETIAALVCEGRLRQCGGGIVRLANGQAPAPAAAPETVPDDAVAALAEIAKGAGASWFGGRQIAAARALWADDASGKRGDLRGGLGDVLVAFRRGKAGIEALERSRRWPAGAGKVALQLALEAIASREAN
jgi:hypothetical protein